MIDRLRNRADKLIIEVELHEPGIFKANAKFWLGAHLVIVEGRPEPVLEALWSVLSQVVRAADDITPEQAHDLAAVLGIPADNLGDPDK